MAIVSRRSLLVLLAASAGFAYFARPRGAEIAEALYDIPLTPPQAPRAVYHLGHSLVGRDMPAMLSQLAGEGHRYHSQLGWGASLRDHWEPDVPVNGFEAENAHAAHRPAVQALASAEYDALVVTEMVELRDAIRYHDTATYLARWAERAWGSNPDMRIYLYETWHHTDDPTGWRLRLGVDYTLLWQEQVLYPALAKTDAPIHVIPAGQVLGSFMDAVEAQGGLPGLRGVADLFATAADGTPDTIHMGDLGAYLVALTHFAVIYHRSPIGLPHALLRADGTPAQAPSPEAAMLMQQTVWEVVTRLPETGVSA
ncbi:MAG: hypothetical protein AAF943_04350 [Pseudomonadota bacterium]